MPPPFPLCCPTVRASAAASGSTSVHLFCHCLCRCRFLCLCHYLCFSFYCSVWLSYQRPWASPAQTNHRSVLWVAHKAIKQGKSRRRKGVGVLETGWHATDACARDFHMTRVTTLPTAAGHGNQIEGGCEGGTRLGRRQMSMSQPKIQKSRAKSDAKKPSKPKKTENREPKTEDTKEPKGDREEMLLYLICERKWLKQILYKYL